MQIETHTAEIKRLSHYNDHLSTEIQTLREKDNYRRELLEDLSTELSLSASRESKVTQELEWLQAEHQQLSEQHISGEITIQSLETREKSISFEIDDLQKELEESAVREALLQCEIAEARGERDALQERLLTDPLAGLLPPSNQGHEPEATEAKTQCPVQ
jgi:chromosome segregation ATPase